MKDFFPLVSVVVSGRNCKNTILNTLNSILSQSYQNIEIVYEDADSTDGTQELVRGFLREKKLQDKFVFNSQKDNSVCEGRNIGLSLSHGEYVCFFDTDDIMLPTRIEKQVDSLEKGKMCSSVAGVRYHTGEEMIPPIDNAPILTKYLRRRNRLIGGTQFWMYKKEILEEIGGYNESIKCFEDTELTFRYLQVDSNVGIVPEALSIWENVDDPQRLTMLHNSTMSADFIKASRLCYDQRINYLLKNLNWSLLIVNISFLAGYEKKFSSLEYLKIKKDIHTHYSSILKCNTIAWLLYEVIRFLRRV